MSTRLRVSDIKPGMFSTEWYVRFAGVGGDYELFVDKASVQDQEHTMDVQLVYTNDEQAVVELPRDTISGHGRVQVPISALAL